MRRAAPAFVLLLLVPALLAGCASPAPPAGRSSTIPTGGATTPVSETPDLPGHELRVSTLQAQSASVTALSFAASAQGTSRWRLADAIDGLATHRALLLSGAVVPQGEGILIALPEAGDITLEGAVTYAAVTVSMDHEMRHRVASEGAPPAGLPSSQMSEELRANGWHEDEFFSQPVDLRAAGAVTVRAARLVLVTEGSAFELGDAATVSEFVAAKSTAQLSRVVAPEAVTLDVTTRRAHLAVVNATGTLAFAERSLDAAPGALVTLAQGSRVELTPQNGGARVRVEGSAYQAITADGPAFESRLELRLAEETLDLTPEMPGRELAFQLVASDPDTDPVIRDIRIEGAPNGTVRLPGWKPITEQLVESFGNDPVALAFVSPALPFVAFLDVFVGIIEMFLGPAEITQTLEAGTTFSSRLGVSQASDGAPYTATMTIEGNFPTTRATLRVA